MVKKKLTTISCFFFFSAGFAPLVLADNLSRYTIDYKLCKDKQGPQCERLRLGDKYISTTRAKKGYLYACKAGRPSAPGSTTSRITWIDWNNQSWNFLKKPWLPSGEFKTSKGTYTERVSGNKRIIKVNNLPVDRKIGNWPMTKYSTLTRIDRNPGVPSRRNFTFSLAKNPKKASRPTCLPEGAIGVTLNGVVLFSAVDARGEDAVAHEIVDQYGGHPARTEYHYHFVPEHLEKAPLASGHSKKIGWIADGFPIYGYYGIGGKEMTNAKLDLCHGHTHGNYGYHYHATLEYPYTVGCFRGTPKLPTRY